jgi:glutathionylspermidine synthase
MSALITCGPSLSECARREVRSRMAFGFGKWDAQYGDTSVLAEFCLVLGTAAWRTLSALAEKLAAEALAAEAEIVSRPELFAALGLPRKVRSALRTNGRTSNWARFMRFDFHLTDEGWRISEVNSDVPGGFLESGPFSSLMAESSPAAQATGDPGRALADAIASSDDVTHVGLVHATAYSDDRQVMAHLRKLLEERGLVPHLIAPNQIDWRDGRAHMIAAWRDGPLDALVRFFPAEWLVSLPHRCGWEHYFGRSATRQANPATALLTQSKRFPLVWDRLATPLPTWRSFLPETRDPRNRAERSWVLKPALGRVGQGVSIAGVTSEPQRAHAEASARLFPRSWAAQRRFRAVPVTAAGHDWYPCLGVFVVNGRVAGAYGRVATSPLIGAGARDIAVLVEREAPVRAVPGDEQ